MDHRIPALQRVVWAYYDRTGRHDLVWRQPEPDGSFDSYKIMVSEIMLQQTQVGRVLPKYQAFLAVFPTIDVLASAPLSVVLRGWAGLGYNRRAKFLWQAAQMVQREYGGHLPADMTALQRLPGIGRNTAGAIMAYAFNQPVVFLETNVRTVFIHHFFSNQILVRDAMLLPLVAESIPEDNARHWYWALMDYGTHLKQTVGNLTRASSTYAKQSKFEGSRRQLRGRVLRVLADSSPTYVQFTAIIPDDRLAEVLAALTQEGLICLEGRCYRLADA